jgi:hypothetical protein
VVDLHVGYDENPHGPTSNKTFNFLPAKSSCFSTTDFLHSMPAGFTVLFSEVEGSRIRRRIWNEPESQEGNGKGDDSVKDEKPAPSLQTSSSVHAIVYAGLHKPVTVNHFNINRVW